MSITDWPSVLRQSPHFKYPVIELNNFRTNRPLGNLVNLSYLMWHHDASNPGPSPGALDWLISSYNAKKPSAQIWINYGGAWYFVGSGRAYHAGVTSGLVTLDNSVGTETDHTTGERMSEALHDSVLRGYAAIFKHEGWPSSRMRFHKIEARPLGRKQDPWFSTNDMSAWNGEWNREVSLIESFMNNAPRDWCDSWWAA